MWEVKAGNTICKMSKEQKWVEEENLISFIPESFNACHLENLMRKGKL